MRVLVADDHPVVRRGLLTMLAREAWVEATVRNQLSSIFAKLGVMGRVQAVLLARDAGIGP